ncbi:MAG: DUF2795 domain-containing protein [Solitalea-like symbiont of Tyrophagus putrescentiae]
MKDDIYWTLDLIRHLFDAPFPATKDELLDYALREGLPEEVIRNLKALEVDEDEIFEDPRDIWPDCPTDDDDYFYYEE